MTKKESRLLAFMCLFLGMVLGFMMAPMKAGVTCASNNTVYRHGMQPTGKPERRGRRNRKDSEIPENGEETDCAF